MKLRKQLHSRHPHSRRRGQVWVETVIYTLIGLSLIALVLAVVTPKINQYKDKALLDQTLNSLNSLNTKVNEVLESPGNRRVVEFKLGRGNIEIDSENDKIIYTLEDSKVKYSEPGLEIAVGKVNVFTEELPKDYKVTFTMTYNLNITSGKKDENAQYTAASLPYQLKVENTGFANGDQVVDISS